MGSHQGCQVPFRTSRRNVGLFLRSCSGQGPHLAKRWEPRGFSRVAAGFSSNDGDLRLPLGLALGSPIFPSSERESWGVRSTHCRAQETHLGVCPGPNIPLQGRQGSRGCIPGSPGSQASSRGEAKDSALLSSRDAGLLEPPERPQGSPCLEIKP